jgi:hypothetical protein
MSTPEDERGTDAAMTLQERPAPDATADEEARDKAEIDAALGGTVGSDATAAPHEAARTRDLLAEIASREPHEPRPAVLERSERRFVRWMLLATLLACAALLGAMWWLDPISVTGRQTRFSVVENGGVRQAKLDLMEELPKAPDVLVLGSSRSMKLDPVEIKRISGHSAFNAGVSGGTTQDMYLYAKYADHLWGQGPNAHYPHLVIGVVNDVLRFTGTAALDPRLKRYLPKQDRSRSKLQIAGALLQMKTVEGGVRGVHRVVKHDGLAALLHPEEQSSGDVALLATTGRQKGNQRENLSPRGMQLFNPGADYSKPLSSRVEVQMRTFVHNGFVADAAYTGVDPRGIDLLHRTIQLANSHGDVPTLWVTPYQPGAVKYMPPAQYHARDRRFRAALEQLKRDDPKLRFTFVDLADISSFGGDPNEFYDGIHMTPKNTAKVLAKLQQLGVLGPVPLRR